MPKQTRKGSGAHKRMFLPGPERICACAPLTLSRIKAAALKANPKLKSLKKLYTKTDAYTHLTLADRVHRYGPFGQKQLDFPART